MNKKLRIHERIRLLIQCISFAFHNGYARGWMKGSIYTGANKAFCVPGLNCYSCPGALGSCPIGSLQAVLDSGEYTVSLYVFGFIAAVGMFCGRFVCGWLCPFGLIQDLLYRIPFAKKMKNLPGHKYLKYLRFVILALFVIILPLGARDSLGIGEPWFCEYICPSGTLLGGIPLMLTNANLRAAIGPHFIWKMALLILILVLSILSNRPFCKYVCPLGAMYGLANPISIYRLRVDSDTCVQCGACQQACPVDIKTWETPNSMDCIRCGKCMKACPTGAITSTFRKKAVTRPEAEQTVETVDDAAAATTVSEKPKGKKGRNGIVILGLVLVAEAIWFFVAQDVNICTQLIKSGLVTSLTTYAQYMGSLAPSLVPQIMAAILGAVMVISPKKPELLDAVRDWPVRILKTLATAFAVGYLIVLVILCIGANGFNPIFVLLAVVYMMYGLPQMIIDLILVLIAGRMLGSFPKKEKRRKKEK